MRIRIIEHLQNLLGFFYCNQLQLTQLRIRVRRHGFSQANKVTRHPFYRFALVQRSCILQSELDTCLFLSGFQRQIKLRWRLFQTVWTEAQICQLQFAFLGGLQGKHRIEQRMAAHIPLHI
ncbi:hypothetical protein D3C74_377970 [compost metagenome]